MRSGPSQASSGGSPSRSVVAATEPGLDRAMVARSPSRAGDYTPAEPARVAVAADGTVAAVCEPSRITLLALPEGVAFAEIDADPEALASEVGWLGTPPRLLVLSRYEAYSTAHLLDPQGPRPIAEIRLETPMRLYATVGATALVVGGLGAAVLAASEAYLTAYPFPTRSVPLTAGAAASQFVVALPASIEEWDPQSRMPRRRLRLPRAAAITAVGGSERMVWLTTQQEPSRIDVIPLVNRGQPRGHELPEPIASIAGHPRSDLVACIGAETGRVYVVDLDGRHRLRILPPDGDGRIESAALVLGRMTGVLAVQAGRAVMIASLDGRPDGRPDGRDEAEPAAARAAAASRATAGEPSGALPSEPPEPSRVEPAAAADSSDEPAQAPVPAATRRPALSLDRAALVASLPAPAPGATPAEVAASSAAAPDLPEEAPEADLSIERGSPVDAASPVLAAPSVAMPASPPWPASSEPASPAVVSSVPSPGLAAPPGLAPALRSPPPAGASSRPAVTAGSRSAPSASARFSAWRDLVRQSQSPAGEPAEDDSSRPDAPPAEDDSPRADAPPAPDAPETSRPAALAAPVSPEAAAHEASPAAEDDSSRADALPAPAAPETSRPAALAAPVSPEAAAHEASPEAAAHEDSPASWRDEVVAWTRAFTAGATDLAPPAAPPIDALIARFDLAPALHRALVLLYGAHLCGERGVAPAEVARVLDRRWDEALGRGELAERGVAEYAGSRVALSPLVLRTLDELPPATGVLVGRPGSVALLGPCVVVAGDEPLVAVAERCAPQIGGAILAATGEPARAELVLEARARGAAPMLRAVLDAAPSDAAIFVIDDPDLAERLGLPRLA